VPYQAMFALLRRATGVSNRPYSIKASAPDPKKHQERPR
jgi:hypothetical protein